MSKEISFSTLILAVFAAGLMTAPVRAGAIIYVDDDAPNDPAPGDPTVSDPDEDGSAEHPFDAIQEGIDGAVDGDEVVLADGTYTGTGNKNLDFGGKAITVRSAWGNPASCIIDCQGDGRGFTFHSGEGEDSIVEGLAVTNGGMGGVCLVNSSPTLANCTISGNEAYDGGGIWCLLSSSPTLTDCTIRGNLATAYFGGGVYCKHSSSPTLINCTISGNKVAQGIGGGVYCKYSSSPTLINCTISGNEAAQHGGGVFCSDYSSPTLTNCTIAWNVAYSWDGGGVACMNHSSPTLTNCTINGNSAVQGDGGGVCLVNSSPTLTNCILWGDTPEEIYVYSGSPAVTYCDVQGGWSGPGNIDADPQFAFPDDYHLMPASPCIDAGTNDPVGGLPVDDLEGNPRPLDGDGDAVAIADMGIYEFNAAGPSIVVRPSTFEFCGPEGGDNPENQLLLLRNSGVGTLNWEITTEAPWLSFSPPAGESIGEVDQVTLSVDTSGLPVGFYPAVGEVADPQAVNSPREVVVMLHVSSILSVPGEYPTIQAAIDAAIEGDFVEIADGTYTGTGNKDLDLGGKAITVRSVSGNPASCIIDCEVDGRGFYFHNGEGPDSIVEGLTITNGRVIPGGGGVLCEAGSAPTFTNCTISENEAYYYGGGISCSNGSAPTFVNCRISENGTYECGGGIDCYNNSSPTLTNCTINANNTGYVGGGIHCDACSSPTLNNCTINGNYSIGGFYEYGGVVFCWDHSNATLNNCIISGNTGGGVCCMNYSSPTLTNCTIVENVGPYYSGGMSCSSSPILTNCILWGNTPYQIYEDQWGDPVVTYCDVQGGWGGAGNIDGNPLFVDADGPDDDEDTWEDNDYRLGAGSPCIDAADNTSVPADAPDLDEDGVGGERLPLDLDGNPRFVDDPSTDDTGVGDLPDYPEVVDMGAYEYWPDCNDNGVPDDEDIADGTSEDCNENGVPDECDIADGTSEDDNDNGIPDECESPPVALCHDVTVEADTSCEGHVAADEVDDGSYDLDGGPVDLSLEPPGPYPLGVTSVTLTVTDDLGQTDTCTATVTVVDGPGTPPTITCPPDVTVECGEPTDPSHTGTATATDNCAPDPVIDFSDSGTPGSCPPESVITRTWTATDASGNSSSCDQVITVEDTTPPSIDIPASNLTVECDGAGNVVELNAWLDSHGGAVASDVCGGVTWSDDFAGLSDDCGATGSATVTFTATDDCGLLSMTTATFTIEDTTPPTITCPTDMTVTCGEPTDPDAAGWATATDICDDDPVYPAITYSDVETPATCPADPIMYTIARTWTATDECGNSSECVQTITVMKVALDLDIKPGSCPNSYNRNSHGVLPIGLLGTIDFDVTMVDLTSVRLSRADCVGGSVAPHEGPPGPHSVYSDVGTPFEGEWCDCHELEGDGFVDLSMKFKTDDVVPTLELDSLSPGALVELVVTGTLADGCGFIASDCVRLVPPGTAPGQLYVESTVLGAWIDASPLDETLDGGGFADFERVYPLTTLVTLTAEMSLHGQSFFAWQIESEMQEPGENTVQFVMDESMTVKALYRAPVFWLPRQMGTETPLPGTEAP